MIWAAAFGAAVGFVFGWMARWVEARRQPLYQVQCGNCHETLTAGPQRQLTVELWANGIMLKQWRVGVLGEYRDTRVPGIWLYDAIAKEVRRVELLQQHRLVLPGPDTPAVPLTVEDGGAAQRVMETGEARGGDRRGPKGAA